MCGYLPHPGNHLTPSVELTTWYLVAPLNQRQSRCHAIKSHKKPQKLNNCNRSEFIPKLLRDWKFWKMRNSYTIYYEDISHILITPAISCDLNIFTELIEYNFLGSQSLLMNLLVLWAKFEHNEGHIIVLRPPTCPVITYFDELIDNLSRGTITGFC